MAKGNKTKRQTPLKAGGVFGCSGRVSSSCSTSGTRRVTLVIIYVIIFLMFCLILGQQYMLINWRHGMKRR